MELRNNYNRVLRIPMHNLILLEKRYYIVIRTLQPNEKNADLTVDLTIVLFIASE